MLQPNNNKMMIKNYKLKYWKLQTLLPVRTQIYNIYTISTYIFYNNRI